MPEFQLLLDLAAEWPTYCYRRLTWMMRRLGWPVNGQRVRRWMDELGITGSPPPRGPRTTNSNHAFPRFPNLVETLTISGPNYVWVGDITYIRLDRKFIYLAVLMEVFTRTRLASGTHSRPRTDARRARTSARRGDAADPSF